MTATPGQAAWTARALFLEGNPDNADDHAEILGRWDTWFDDHQREAEEVGAQAGIDVFLAGDSVSAGSIREALAAQEPHAAPAVQPRPGYVTVNARDIAIALNGYAGFTGDPVSFASELHERLRRTVFGDQAPEPKPAPELAALLRKVRALAAEHAGCIECSLSEELETVLDGAPGEDDVKPAPELAAVRGEVLAEVLAWIEDPAITRPGPGAVAGWRERAELPS